MLLRALCVLLVVATPAQAALEITAINAPQARILPEIEAPALEAEVTVDCSSLWLRDGGPLVTAGVVRIEFVAPDGVHITGPTDTILNPSACLVPTGQDRAVGKFQVSVSRDIPGLQAVKIDAKASLVSSSPVPDPAEDNKPFVINVGAYLNSRIKVAEKLRVCGCPVDFDIEVENYGNVRTQYVFSLGTEDGGFKGNVVLPEVLLLDRPSAAGVAVETVTVRYQAPSGPWGEEAFQIVVTPTAADDASVAGNPYHANFLVRNGNALERAAPLPLAPGLGLLLVALAAIARRRA